MVAKRKAGHAHVCAVPGCGAQISRGKLMCLEHWRMVPRPLQRAVSRTWRAFSGGATPESRSAAIRPYRDAVADAVAAVEEALP